MSEDRSLSWIRFPDRRAILKRFADPTGLQGLILRVAETPSGEETARRATAIGFSRLASGHVFTLAPPFPFGLARLADELGGELVPATRAELIHPDMLIRLKRPLSGFAPVAPSRRRETARPRPQPDVATLRHLGLNLRGEAVVADAAGRWIELGRDDFHPEAELDGPPSRFLRAPRLEDIPGIAAGLLRLARRRTIHLDDVEALLDAALEPATEGPPTLDRDLASERLRLALLRQVGDAAVAGDGDRAAFREALRLADAIGFVTARASADDTALRPSAAFVAALRRLVSGRDEVDASGHPDLDVLLPAQRTPGAALQLHDLSGLPADRRAEYAINAIARRPDEGLSLFIAPDDDMESVERMRDSLGRAFGLEAVARVAPDVSDGLRDGRGVMLFVVGERRPDVLPSLPRAALRTFEAVLPRDLLELEREVLRSRARIRDFNRGEVEQAAPADEDDREENRRQRPYRPLSRVSEPFSMIPKALDAATARALERLARSVEAEGGVDAVVAAAIGVAPGALRERLTAEQVDAVGLRLEARARERGFLLADQTGVGKGRSLAAMSLAHLRGGPGRRVLYLTESPQINMPDVCRDLAAVGALDAYRVMPLTSGGRFERVSVDPETGAQVEIAIEPPSLSVRREIFDSRAWPRGVDLVIATYSQFNCREEDPRAVWLTEIAGPDTMLVLDEAHNALNPKSNTGRNFRALIEALPKENVVFGTATPARDPRGLNLYAPLMPRTAELSLQGLLDRIESGGEIAQEAFATMLAEDGVMLRRDHDLSNIEFEIRLPDDERLRRNQAFMDRLSPILEGMFDVAVNLDDFAARARAAELRRLVLRGLPEQVARQRSNALHQYNMAVASPLAAMARFAMNALKIDAVVEAALIEIERNRKPLITFHSTNASLLSDLIRDERGERLSEAEIEALPTPTFKDQVKRIFRRLTRMRRDGEVVDARELMPNVEAAARRVEEMIDALPDDLPASPIDALVERLEAEGLRVGEISGRGLQLREGRIAPRPSRNRREVIDAFNGGGLDVLIYNSAGATGGSYHAAPEFDDRRGRSMIELETPLDIIKYVQGQGRGNRYGQVARPKVVSVTTGLVPELRILQQRNAKLRALGATVDGNRAHPLLLDDVPDLLNRVGDQAAFNVLSADPRLARRLGFTEIADRETEEARRFALDLEGEDSGADRDLMDSLSNRALTRSIILSAREQDELVQRLRLEFDAMIEELDSRNANPLRPKELAGWIEPVDRSIYAGRERAADDLATSAFLSPLYMVTGTHHFDVAPVSAERLVTLVERAVNLHGAEGLAVHAERLRQQMPALLRYLLPDGIDLAAALRDPARGGRKFARLHGQITDLAWLLENCRPGVEIRIPDGFGQTTFIGAVVTDLKGPTLPELLDWPSAYGISVVHPGDSEPQKISLSRLMTLPLENFRFLPGLSEGPAPEILQRFTEATARRRELPVQVLEGNVLQAISTAEANKLGSISLYRDAEGRVNRGIVVDPGKIDLRSLPIRITPGPVLAEAVEVFLERAGQDADQLLSIRSVAIDKVGRDVDGVLKTELAERLDIDVTPRSARIDIVPFRQSTIDFYRRRPGLYEALHGAPQPPDEEAPERAFRRRGVDHRHVVQIPLGEAEGRRRLSRIIQCLGETPLQMSGRHRSLVVAAAERVDRIREDRTPEETEAPAEPEAAAGVAAPTPIDPAPALEPAETFDLDAIEWN